MSLSPGFYAHVRQELFDGKMSQSQVDGCKTIFDATQGWSTAFQAYALATAFHETGATMQPILERGGPTYLSKYGRPPLAARLGNRDEAEGIKLCGRGYVMITGHDNYVKAGVVVGQDLLAKPDLAMDPVIAAKIMRSGMEKGWFTGKKLSDYFPDPQGNHVQAVNARRIINGTDRAEDIANYFDVMQDGLNA